MSATGSASPKPWGARHTGWPVNRLWSSCATADARCCTRPITTAFADIGYIPVLRREAEGLLSDDGVLTGTHQAAFLGVPGYGRRVHQNVHVKTELRADGRLGDMDMETSLAGAVALKLRSTGGDVAAAEPREPNPGQRCGNHRHEHEWGPGR